MSEILLNISVIKTRETMKVVHAIFALLRNILKYTFSQNHAFSGRINVNKLILNAEYLFGTLKLKKGNVNKLQKGSKSTIVKIVCVLDKQASTAFTSAFQELK